MRWTPLTILSGVNPWPVRILFQLFQLLNYINHSATSGSSAHPIWSHGTGRVLHQMVDHGFGNPFHCVECAWFYTSNDNVMVANAPNNWTWCLFFVIGFTTNRPLVDIGRWCDPPYLVSKVFEPTPIADLWADQAKPIHFVWFVVDIIGFCGMVNHGTCPQWGRFVPRRGGW